MKPSTVLGPLMLLLSAAPLCAHGVFVPLPRNPSGGALEYEVKILATNQGLQTRRFQVFQVFPQPFGSPTEEKLSDRNVLARTVGTFKVPVIDDFSGLLRVTGAPQMVIGARLEVRENGALIETVSLPVITTSDEDGEEHAATPPVKHDDGPGTTDLDHVSQLLGLATTQDGGVSSDFALLNISEKEPAACAAEFFLPAGPSIVRLPAVFSPVGSAAFFDDFLQASGDPEQPVDAEDIRGQVSCEKDSFFAWATVYRNGGRDVAIITQAASTK